MKQYTKKQIQEAINYWKKQLRTMNEAEDMDKELLKKAGHEAFEYVDKKVKERKRCEAGNEVILDYGDNWFFEMKNGMPCLDRIKTSHCQQMLA